MDTAVGDAHSRKGTDLLQWRFVESRGCHPGLISDVECSLAADDRIRPVTALREDRSEGLVDGVGENVRAAHCGDAEDDGERREDGAQLAPEEFLESESGHALSSCSISSTISCAERSFDSRTMSPSAMNRMRSAIAAARASCVTITIVCSSSCTDRLRTSRISPLVFESRLPVGSSAKTIVGLLTRARPMA